MQTKNIYVFWSTSELRVRLAPWNRFKPSSKIFYWPFQGGTSFVDLLCFFLSCFCYVFVRVCLYVPCGQLLGKGWPLGSRLWCLTVSLSLSYWYPGSGGVLDCIDSWSLHPYLLRWRSNSKKHLIVAHANGKYDSIIHKCDSTKRSCPSHHAISGHYRPAKCFSNMVSLVSR